MRSINLSFVNTFTFHQSIGTLGEIWLKDRWQIQNNQKNNRSNERNVHEFTKFNTPERY